ncbi:DUF2382 domain-containing protein [Exiguobacterium acetylicum]|uniref:DUF2382 domain-containing protein n=1 Tax=Exiguobacterium TaxID=33986 RepID=UPI0006FB79CD|nr:MULTISPECIES: DUF2382 domain-containing protein [Exiguobacterium]KQS37592.1 hypothetical protein ASG02_11480 [Exiguobacterium sp. Leaf196]MDQ6468020.1 DUF2382 domain-containing protein [Exiguobacterium acetylicum]
MTRKEDTFIQVFNTQAEVLSKVNELKAQGYDERDMYVVAQDKHSFSMVENQTNVNVDTAGEQEHQGFMGKFMAAFSDDSSTEAFRGMGLSHDESEEYRRQVESGKLVLYVDSDYGDSYEKHSQSYNQTSGVNDNQYDRTGVEANRAHNDHLSDNGSLSRTDRDQGYDNTLSADRSQDYDDTPGVDRSGVTETNSDTEEERLRLHEERLNVDKERVQTGEVNVSKHVVEDQQSIEVPVEREEVYVERRKVDHNASGTDAFVDENDSIHVPLSEEKVVVSKEDVVSEEIVVGKRKVRDTETVSETVRREEADIDEGTDTRTDVDRDDHKRL